LLPCHAFARTADDFADEGQLSHARRLDLLEGWARTSSRRRAGETTIRPPRTGEPPDTQSLFLQLATTMRVSAAASGAVRRTAERIPAGCHRPSVRDVDRSCSITARRSANPVGRIVLRVAGYRDARLDQWSDADVHRTAADELLAGSQVDYSAGAFTCRPTTCGRITRTRRRCPARA
jgi:hypothetical protein